MSQMRMDEESIQTEPTSKREATLVQLTRRTFGALSTAQARAALEVRPDPVATVRRSGPNPVRLLCFGGGALRGAGYREHELALPGRVADEIAQQTGRGVQLDVVVEVDPTAPRALTLLSGLRLRRYDAVVVVLGDEAARYGSPDRWRGALVGLTRILQNETCPTAGVFMYDSTEALAAKGFTPLAARSDQRARMVAVCDEVCALAERIRFAELGLIKGLDDRSGRLSHATFTDWAQFIVGRLEPTFKELATCDPAASPRAFRNRPEDERFRQRAVEALRLVRGAQDEQLDRELTAARTMFRTTRAALNIVDGPVQWSKASSDGHPNQVAREDSFCGFAIRSDELTLINDTWLDPRTRSNPFAQGEGAIRFYAGFPVHSVDGYRIGMVCVYGDKPRSFRPSELEGLRDVAARVEQHLWNDALRGRRP